MNAGCSVAHVIRDNDILNLDITDNIVGLLQKYDSGRILMCNINSLVAHALYLSLWVPVPFKLGYEVAEFICLLDDHDINVIDGVYGLINENVAKLHIEGYSKGTGKLYRGPSYYLYVVPK